MRSTSNEINIWLNLTYVRKLDHSSSLEFFYNFLARRRNPNSASTYETTILRKAFSSDKNIPSSAAGMFSGYIRISTDSDGPKEYDILSFYRQSPSMKAKLQGSMARLPPRAVERTVYKHNIPAYPTVDIELTKKLDSSDYGGEVIKNLSLWQPANNANYSWIVPLHIPVTGRWSS